MPVDASKQRQATITDLVTANWLRLVALLTVVAILAIFLNIYFDWRDDLQRVDPAIVGIVFLGFLYATFVLMTGTWRIWLAVNGADGSASTSKFQFFVWTGVVLFAYAAVTAALFQVSDDPDLPALPPSVIVVLGLSGATAAGAKILTVQNIGTGKISDASRGDAPTAPGYPQRTDAGPLFLADDGQPDVGKIQLVGFTFLAMAVFLTASFELISSILEGAVTKVDELPAIDDMLLVLMGFGSAAYVGSKWVLSPPPVLASRRPDVISLSGTATQRALTINGANFGAKREMVVVLLDHIALETQLDEFSETKLVCTVPRARPDGDDWTTGQPLELRVSVAGRMSTNGLSLQLVP